MALRVRYTETPTGNVYIDSLVSEYQFFDTAVPAGQPITITYRLAGTISWATDNAAAAIRGALDAWSAVVNVVFVETTSTSATWTETLYSDTGSFTLGSHYYPNLQSLGGEFNVGHPLSTTTNNQRGGIGFVTYLHELGHGLGLNHPFEPDPFPGVTPGDPYDRGDNNLNNGIYTVMAYDDDPWFASPPGYSYGYAATPMAFDIAAAQTVYGANMTTATDSSVYTLPSANGSGTFWTCIWDAGGIDTIRAAIGATAACTIDLRAATLLNAEGGGGYASRQNAIYGGFTIAHGVVIENAIGGGGADVIHGNAAANRLEGLGGNDSIYGHDGDDIIIGGAGADNLWGGAGADRFTYTLASDSSTSARDIIHDFVSGTDKIDLSALAVTSFEIVTTGGLYLNALIGTVTLSIDIRSANGFIVSDIIGVTSEPENLNLRGTDSGETLTGGAGNDRIRGFGGNDILRGLDGNDSLDGGTGDDRMEGGRGDDNYTVDAIGDIVVELAGEGVDTVFSFIADYTLTDHVERLILKEGAVNGTGNALANDIIGNAADNHLIGGDGNDVLVGREGNDILDGGAGDDVMDGGAGDDIYYVDSRRDKVSEAAGNGDDSVFSSASTFRLGANVENLILIGAAGGGYGNDQANRITGNDLGNFLSGEGGNDVIDGGGGNDIIWGGAGADSLTGGSGADLFRYKANDFGGLTAATAERITDFDASEGDRIDLRLVDAIYGGADDGFTFIGAAAFTGAAGQLRYAVGADHILLLGDRDGDGLADLAIRLDGLTMVEASAILL